jgi:hypothetical protein
MIDYEEVIIVATYSSDKLELEASTKESLNLFLSLDGHGGTSAFHT